MCFSAELYYQLSAAEAAGEAGAAGGVGVHRMSLPLLSSSIWFPSGASRPGLPVFSPRIHLFSFLFHQRSLLPACFSIWILTVHYRKKTFQWLNWLHFFLDDFLFFLKNFTYWLLLSWGRTSCSLYMITYPFASILSGSPKSPSLTYNYPKCSHEASYRF